MFVSGELAGTGLLALPQAVGQSGNVSANFLPWTKTCAFIPLLCCVENASGMLACLCIPGNIFLSGWIGIPLIVIFGMVSGYNGMNLGRCWTMLLERYPEMSDGKERRPYPALGQKAFGAWMRWPRTGEFFCRNKTLHMTKFKTLKAKTTTESLSLCFLQNTNLSVNPSEFVWKLCRVPTVSQWERPVNSAGACRNKHFFLLLASTSHSGPSSIGMAWNTKRLLVKHLSVERISFRVLGMRSNKPSIWALPFLPSFFSCCELLSFLRMFCCECKMETFCQNKIIHKSQLFFTNAWKRRNKECARQRHS